MKTRWNFSTKMGMTALPSISLPGNPAETKAKAAEHALNHGGQTDVYTMTAVCRFPGMKRDTAFDHRPDGSTLGNGKGRYV